MCVPRPKNDIGPTAGRQTRMRNTLKDLTESTQSFSQKLDGFIAVRAAVGEVDRVSGSVSAAYDRLKPTLGLSPDIVIRRFAIGAAKTAVMVLFVNGQIDNNILDRDTLMMTELTAPLTESPQELFTRLTEHFLAVGHVTTESSWSKTLFAVFEGSVALFVDGVPQVILLDAPSEILVPGV